MIQNRIDTLKKFSPVISYVQAKLK